ncbi:DoxX family protein [Danxiaibacter flavus]|uniref:DoxX family protein n=1 Tax=Danxiaibacter flavus TaxID=3049108 RepID=A0ABV3ZL67_9BACT|nr:DoxX family protein [Chitinophagaceae bacterium DXS]
MRSNIFIPKSQSITASLALLILRLIAGTAFIIHGWLKIQHPDSWVPAGAPISIPAFFQVLAAISEFCGGIAWILGLLTPLASFGIGCTMGVAVYFHAVVFGDPFVNLTGGHAFELPLMFLGLAVSLLLTGPGQFSLDAKIFVERTFAKKAFV